MNLEELEEKVKRLEDKVKTFEDIEKIKMLQRIYGYYLDNMMHDEAADLFTDDAIADFGHVVNKGKENIRTSFRNLLLKGQEGTKRLQVHLMLQGVVNIEPGGQTAKGRWQLIPLLTEYLGKPPGELQPIIGHAVYDNEYIKENGIWKIKRLTLNSSFTCILQDGWVKQTKVDGTYPKNLTVSDIRQDVGDRTWRSGYKVPCHFKNPVTGR